MFMSRKLFRGLIVTVALTLSASSLAQEPVKQESTTKPRQEKTGQRPKPEAVEKIEPIPNSAEADDAMRRAVTSLTSQIELLTEEVRGLKRETERSSGMLELLINEERLAKLEDKIQEAANQKAQLDAREQEIQRRMRNIQGELVFRGGLRREEAEAAARNDLQRALEEVRAMQIASGQRAAELNEQATRLRSRVETVRKRLELLEGTREKQDK